MNAELARRAERRMQELLDNAGGDQELDHAAADAILTDTLRALGYMELARLYDAVPKWYA